MIHTNEDIEKRIRGLEKLLYSVLKERPTLNYLVYDDFEELEKELKGGLKEGTKDGRSS